MAQRAIRGCADAPSAARWFCSATPAAPICRRPGSARSRRYIVPTSRELEDRDDRDTRVWEVLAG